MNESMNEWMNEYLVEALRKNLIEGNVVQRNQSAVVLKIVEEDKGG